MNPQLFQPTAEGELRLLLLINAFSNQPYGMQGRTKLAKLDFLLRYPAFLRRALAARGHPYDDVLPESNPLEQRMVRYRYGPWDPSYIALLGSLIGRGLIEVVPYPRGLGYKTTQTGATLAGVVGRTAAWASTAAAVQLLRHNFNQAGSTLKKLVYDVFPEITAARWEEPL
jgi:hypothetical protein